MRLQTSNRHDTVPRSSSRRRSYFECDLIALAPLLQPSSTLYERWTIAEDAARPELKAAQVERNRLKFAENPKTWLITKFHAIRSLPCSVAAMAGTGIADSPNSIGEVSHDSVGQSQH